MVSSSPTGGNFYFLRHLDAINFVQKWQKCQICVVYEDLECLISSYKSAPAPFQQSSVMFLSAGLIDKFVLTV